MTKGQPAIVGSIADAVTVKNLNLYYVVAPDGQMPLDGDHGFGLYFNDCRFLSGYEMTIGDISPMPLASTAERGYRALFELTNPDLHLEDGQLIPKEELGIRWERILDAEQTTAHEILTFRNLGQEVRDLPVTFRFRAGFEDVFNVRELLQEVPGNLEPSGWRDGKLKFVYHGADQIRRTVTIQFSPEPDRMQQAAATLRIKVPPRDTGVIAVTINVRECAKVADPEQAPSQPLTTVTKLSERLRKEAEQWVEQNSRLHSDSLVLNSVVHRSLLDLGMLRSQLEEKRYFAAGVPWFVALFGRDSLIVSLQMLAFQPDIAAQTLRLLAGYQGQRIDHWRDEQPGKILHELRVGELARIGEIPHTPFYGTVDATPLFLLLLGRLAAWTGDLALFDELRNPVERALAWLAEYGDISGNGYVEYQSESEKGLINHGWKDSGDAIVQADGTPAMPPIALVEVQGYVFAAKHAIADLFERAGDSDRAKRLRSEAEALKTRFNRDFWCEDQGTFALALEAHGRQVAVVSSNPGQALWTGIADEDKAHRSVNRLMKDDMFSGWGVRTLSTVERRYNPVGYHLGTVWPHDNAFLAAGFRRHGEDAQAMRIFTATIEAAMHFRHHRLPEVMAGFRREDFQVPVHYPVACHPQAWAAGSVPFLISTCLGLEPDGFANRLRIVRPLLPDFVDRIRLSGLRVGRGTADLEFQRRGEGTNVNVSAATGGLEVEVAPE
ncbi:glycogen debranching N-terminal domain-containing protein [Mesorhizobium sp. WSM2239]|uniref:Glycogen debranching N-terminal domain-containing protein n=2 Tax=unclassified Mesorhizobium TaxID=325217 RepID=A0AAU8D2S1_9HYPH